MVDTTQRNLYRDSGVDVAKGDELVNWLQEGATADQHGLGEVVSGIGGFAALFRPKLDSLEDPLLVTATDGVGTKVLLGIEHNQLEGLGVDLVAMCVNDLYTVGGRPLFFLDYYATGVLDPQQFKAVLSGIRLGLKQCGAALLGGETAELPGLYSKGHFDLAGFVVGVVDGQKRLQPQMVREGDILIALKSSGFHSNGYSLIRKWLAEKPADERVLQKILEPTKIYFEIPSILSALPWGSVHALANITGGGISGNLPRVLPDGLDAQIEKNKVPVEKWMQDFYRSHGAEFEEVESVFNLGAGMIAVLSPKFEEAFITLCRQQHLSAQAIGRIVEGQGASRVRFI